MKCATLKETAKNLILIRPVKLKLLLGHTEIISIKVRVAVLNRLIRILLVGGNVTQETEQIQQEGN